MLFMKFKLLELKLRVILIGHSVAMITYCVTKMMTTCSLMIGRFFDNMIVASTDNELLMTHQNLILRKCWKLF